MDVSEIKDRDSFQAWLKDKPEEWAQVLAARCALRVAPLAWSVAALSDDILEKKHRENLTLLTFRANFISSAGRKYPADDMRAFASAAASAAFAAASVARAFAAASASASASVARAFAAAPPPPPPPPPSPEPSPPPPPPPPSGMQFERTVFGWRTIWI